MVRLCLSGALILAGCGGVPAAPSAVHATASAGRPLRGSVVVAIDGREVAASPAGPCSIGAGPFWTFDFPDWEAADRETILLGLFDESGRGVCAYSFPLAGAAHLS